VTRRPDQAYHDSSDYELVIFDLRIAGVAGRLHRERAAWQECGDLEALDEDHFVLVARLGGAWEIAVWACSTYSEMRFPSLGF
jgi:hypothetical protein